MLRLQTCLIRCPCAGEEVPPVMSVDGDKQDLGVRVKLLLCTITVMNILLQKLFKIKFSRKMLLLPNPK